MVDGDCDGIRLGVEMARNKFWELNDGSRDRGMVDPGCAEE